jgi:hypothetical protein
MLPLHRASSSSSCSSLTHAPGQSQLALPSPSSNPAHFAAATSPTTLLYCRTLVALVRLRRLALAGLPCHSAAHDVEESLQPLVGRERYVDTSLVAGSLGALRDHFDLEQGRQDVVRNRLLATFRATPSGMAEDQLELVRRGAHTPTPPILDLLRPLPLFPNCPFAAWADDCVRDTTHR